MRLVTTAEMRAIERGAFARGVRPADLMETAGSAVAHAAAAWLGQVQGRRVLALVGAGNNGGDAIIAARVLTRDYGARPSLFLTAAREDDPLLAWARRDGVPLATYGSPDAPAETLRRWLAEADVVLDGILGIGGRLPLTGAIAEVVQLCRQVSPLAQRRIAVDVPTGVHADTGAADAQAFRAQLTLTTGPAKVGLFIHPGAEHAGRVRSVDLGIAMPGDPPALWRLEAPEVAGTLPPRPDDSNKGTYGKVLVIAGSGRYVGAAFLTANAAVHGGAGLVTLAVPGAVQRAVAGRSVETTYLPLPEDTAIPDALTPHHLQAIVDGAAGYDVVAVGPGMGSHPATRQFVAGLIAHLAADPEGPLVVIDADALNALADASPWPHPSTMRWVLTPHPGEMGRLRRLSVREVQADRLATARQSARAWGQAVVLKGAPAIIAGPDGTACLNAFANATLATAGSGDVLTGTIAALLAQGLDPFTAGATGSYVHALAAELWRAEHGAAGLAAGQLPEYLPAAMRHLRASR